MAEYIFTDELDVDDYQRLRDEVGFKALPREEAQAGLDNAYANIAVKYEGETVGIARLLWDGSYCAYLTDVAVTEKHRHHQLATMMVQRLIDKLRAEKKEGWQIKIHLLADLDRESFYERFGFVSRPNDISGAGMDLWL
ncbi:MAG: GNAT family N-acetyltransferase [Oscillospiraceae bacterium]|nr:GNAT family N-acetyltransferase [Oscillospiraceae bacterium]